MDFHSLSVGFLVYEVRCLLYVDARPFLSAHHSLVGSLARGF